MIKEARKAKGITLVELGKKIECSHAHLSQIETGKSNPSRSLLDKISEELDLYAFDLYEAYGIYKTGSFDRVFLQKQFDKLREEVKQMRDEIENPIISERHPIKDPQAYEPDIYAECDGCGEFIYEGDDHVEFEDSKTIYFHDKDLCMAHWVRECGDVKRGDQNEYDQD